MSQSLFVFLSYVTDGFWYNLNLTSYKFTFPEHLFVFLMGDIFHDVKAELLNISGIVIYIHLLHKTPNFDFSTLTLL